MLILVLGVLKKIKNQMSMEEENQNNFKENSHGNHERFIRMRCAFWTPNKALEP